ncbi:MAG TPA: hypothetical protein VGR14_22260 [Verrucomicrobiae bacterium]|nr:hypothetical protein [Verrucomicrobiae bacterium]
MLALASEYASDNTTSVDPCAIVIAQGFLRALPEGVALPEFSVEPGGSISLDWIESRSRLFSLSIGGNHRFAYAWLDGTNKGHGVESFDGQQIPERLLDGITAIVRNGNASIRPA